MMQPLTIYNSLSRQKELFKPIKSPFVGLYVCGPTVYSDVHLGNCRTFISFDLLFRYLQHIGYKVRYVRNITDAGHLEGDTDDGEDKISKKAKLEQLEPMEVVQKYTVDFHEVMRTFNVLPPSIEPAATAHIIEQIEMIRQIMTKGYAYEVNGTVYFDVEKYNQQQNYGILSGRKLEDLLENTRELGGQDEKKGRLDFALWIRAEGKHLMQWPSPWGMGFPGWHLECSAMSNKYLGEKFDIHGGGIDLIPTHHTNEIAQNVACCDENPANYWIHTNMLTVNGQKMSKSLGNSFLPHELFKGTHPLLNKGYSPMTVRFFMLQAHYRSTLDFSNQALEAAEKGLRRLMAAAALLDRIQPGNNSNYDIPALEERCYAAMNDDFNSPVAIAELFDAARVINSINDGKESITAADLERLKKIYKLFLFDIFGLQEEQQTEEGLDESIRILIDLRKEARERKDFATADMIRNRLLEAGFLLHDGKEGTNWSRA
ncbi:cysteine--tRNA ligase [Anseongella ginsenosidimutans]|uniref:cysteine--tRNA ligase n=1 Tax=Anseongella ginsenosidimutans TaxID=496056 RepID=UPI001A9D1803|nr:cysteine--tRNA ligase [Anseongella ginsenosidimutans]